MHGGIVVRQQLFAEIHSGLGTNERLSDVATFLQIGSIAVVEPFDDRVPFGALKFVQFFDVLELAFIFRKSKIEDAPIAQILTGDWYNTVSVGK